MFITMVLFFSPFLIALLGRIAVETFLPLPAEKEDSKTDSAPSMANSRVVPRQQAQPVRVPDAVQPMMQIVPPEDTALPAALVTAADSIEQTRQLELRLVQAEEQDFSPPAGFDLAELRD